MCQQEIAERQHELPVFARVGVGDPCYLAWAHGTPRLRQQLTMQPALGRTGIIRRHQFRPRKIGLQKFVGHDEPAAVIAVEQMVAAGDPEIVHRRRGSTVMSARLRCWSDSASSSISMNENALLWRSWPSFSCNRRKDSRTSPSPTVRWT